MTAPVVDRESLAEFAGRLVLQDCYSPEAFVTAYRKGPTPGRLCLLLQPGLAKRQLLC